jgi:hypothetical protein
MHYNPENWYGALYYAVRPVVEGGIRYWLVLGLDYGNPYMTRKVIDVLDFSGDKLKIGNCGLKLMVNSHSGRCSNMPQQP